MQEIKEAATETEVERNWKFGFLKQDKELNDTEKIWNLEKEFEQRKLTLERKLLELYSLKEQQTYISQLRKSLEEKMKEINMLNVTSNYLHNKINHLQKEKEEIVLAEKQVAVEKIEDRENAEEHGCQCKQFEGPIDDASRKCFWISKKRTLSQGYCSCEENESPHRC